jgi:hypothetical protein
MQTTTLPAQGLPTTNDAVIPAVRGEFYGYAAVFTPKKPLYVFMKCKSNKQRPHAFVGEYPQECNLFFSFDSEQIVAIQTAIEIGLLGETDMMKRVDETWIAPANISAERFYGLRSRKDEAALARIVSDACLDRKTSVALLAGHVYAAMSKAGKYCLFYVESVDENGVRVEACHVLI